MDKGNGLVRERYLERLTQLKGNGAVKALTGMRGVGKSTILRQYREKLIAEGRPADSIIGIDFESVAYAGIGNTDAMVSAIREAAGDRAFYVLILEEPEKVEGWTAALYNLIQEGKCDIYMTSSVDIGPTLKGSSVRDRVQEIRVDPLSLREFMDLNGLADPVSACEIYMRYGGLPLVRADMDDDLAMAVLRGALSDILLNGALDTKGGDDDDRVKDLFLFLAANAGKALQGKDIADAVGKSPLFAEKYLKALLESFVVYEQPDEGSKLLKSVDRYYIADAGIRSCVKGIGSGWKEVAESVVYGELRRRGYDVRSESCNGAPAFAAETPKGRGYYSALPSPVADEGAPKKFGFGGKTTRRWFQMVPREELYKGGVDMSDFLLEKDLVS